MIRWCLLALVLITGQVNAETYKVGSKNFTESYLLAEMLAQLLEVEGHKVERRFGLGGTLVCFEALVNREIDVYIEYTGTLEQVILKGSDLHPTVSSLNNRLAAQQQPVKVLDSLGFNNTYAMALKASLSESLGLNTVSQLGNQPDLKVAFSLEFLNREDGWPGLSSLYNLPHQPTGIDHGLAYQAIDDGKIDITDAYSTDGDLERYQLTVLKDDRGYFPDYLAVPFVHQSLDDEVLAILSQLAGRLDDETMRGLNAKVVVDGRSFADVASEYLKSVRLTEGNHQQQSLSDDIFRHTIDHLQLTIIALSLGCLVGLPLGIIAFRHRAVSRVVVYFAGLLQTIPSIALLALMIPLFGIGMLPAIVALFLYSILPILRNTITALITIDPLLKRVAEAIGLTPTQQLRYVLIPLAMPNILAGVKTAAVISIGTATLAAFIGAGGLGEPIVTGLALNDTRLILQGAIPAACLAIVVELLFEALERVLVKPHLLSGQLPE